MTKITEGPNINDALYELRVYATSKHSYMTPEGFNEAMSVVAEYYVEAAARAIIGIVERHGRDGDSIEEAANAVRRIYMLEEVENEQL